MNVLARTLRRPPISDGIGAGLGVCAAVLLAVAVIAETRLGLSPFYALKAVGLFAAGGGAVLYLAAHRSDRNVFGLANQITLLRVALTALLLALIGESPAAPQAWFAVSVTAIVLLLDGVDGKVARRRGEVSAFGARFDMETDAALLLVLALLCWQFGKTGAWVLGFGLARYCFVAAAMQLDWMRRPLPYSRRRQAVCVFAVLALLFALLPPAGTLLAGTAAAAGLALLIASFAVDVSWLAARRH